MAKPISFHCVASKAKTVSLVGDFTMGTTVISFLWTASQSSTQEPPEQLEMKTTNVSRFVRSVEGCGRLDDAPALRSSTARILRVTFHEDLTPAGIRIRILQRLKRSTEQHSSNRTSRLG
jgi:hypothetical protein